MHGSNTGSKYRDYRIVFYEGIVTILISFANIFMQHRTLLKMLVKHNTY